MRVHIRENEKVSYDIKPDKGANILDMSEFSLIKASNRGDDHQHRDDKAKLELLPEMKQEQDERLEQLGSTTRDLREAREILQHAKVRLDDANTVEASIISNNSAY